MTVVSDWNKRRSSQRALYPRQKEALILLAQGCKYGEIAALLGVKLGTARSYIGGAVLALGAENPQHALELARETGALTT